MASKREQLAVVAPEPTPAGELPPNVVPLPGRADTCLPGAVQTTKPYYSFIKEHPEVAARDVGVIAKWVPDPERVLDLGCGAGGFLDACQDRFDGVLGIDVSRAAALTCQENGLVAMVADGGQLPFASNTFDVIRAREVIEHIPDLLPFTREIFRVLKPGGLFMSHTPTQYSTLYPVTNFWDDFTHIRPVSRMGLVRLLHEAGFEAPSISGYTAGRNAIERALCAVVGRFFPYTWLALCRKPEAVAPSLSLVEPPAPARLEAAA